MGAANFHAVNAQAMYVIDYEDDEFMWRECQEHLGNWIKELDKSFEIDNSIRSYKELRSYSTSSIGYWAFSMEYLGLAIELTVNLFLRSGYYEAANLDYELTWTINWNDCYGNLETVDDVLYDLLNYPTDHNITKGLIMMQQHNLTQKLTVFEENSRKHIEYLLAQVSTPYGVLAQFSNGETIYTKVEA